MTEGPIKPPSPGMVEVTIESSSQVDPALEDAVAKVKDAAIHHRTGIMITRTGPGRYIVRAHPAVPWGLIRQIHE
jgi:hypothetical protein